jgi:hypothetical protein
MRLVNEPGAERNLRNRSRSTGERVRGASHAILVNAAHHRCSIRPAKCPREVHWMDARRTREIAYAQR